MSYVVNSALRWSLLVVLFAVVGMAIAWAAEPESKPAQPAGPKAATKLTSVETIRKALCEKANLACTESPLTDVMDELSKAAGISIVLDRKAMNDVGIDTTTPVTANLKGLPLKSVLKLILREVDLTTLVRDDVLLITTPEVADANLTTEVYDVTDLVIAHDENNKPWHDFDSLVNMITSTIAPTTWDDVGGPGSISPGSFGPAAVIVVNQTEPVHEQVATLLQKLREVARNHEKDGEAPRRNPQPKKPKPVAISPTPVVG